MFVHLGHFSTGWRDSMARPLKQIIEYRTYDLEPDKPFVCLSGEEWRISDVLSTRLHFHNCMEIGYCFSDSGFLGFEDGVTLPFQTGDIFIIPRFVPHTTCSSPGCRSRWNYLFMDMDSFVRRDLPEGLKNSQSMSVAIGNYLHLSSEKNSRLYFICKCLLEEAKKHPEGDPTLFALYSALLSAELRSLSHTQPQKKGSAKSRGLLLQPALEYINDHFMENCSIDLLAACCHLSQTHLRRLFLSIMGTSPLQYVIQVRIRQACILLNTTSEPITSIAQAVGISSISSFNRNFLQIMGVSPQQYRLSNKPAAAKQKQYILPYKGWIVPENL